MKIKKDKFLHFMAGLLMFFTSLALFLLLSILNPWLWALAFTIVCALAKEIYDYFHPKKHKAEIADLFATVLLPAIIAFVLWWWHYG